VPNHEFRVPVVTAEENHTRPGLTRVGENMGEIQIVCQNDETILPSIRADIFVGRTAGSEAAAGPATDQWSASWPAAPNS